MTLFFSSSFLLTAALLLAIAAPGSAGESMDPNVVFILCDDLGYGDVGACNPESKIATPNMDRLAAEGMRFTDAHSSSSVCTPTRYGILTGRYNWRSRLQSGVLGGYSTPLIEPGRLTLPAMLKQHGYHTACIGKWHLGMNWPLYDGGVASDYPDAWKVDYEHSITGGPNSAGFDYYFGISASLDMPPYVFIENDRATSIPTVEKKWIRQGPAAADFEAIDVLPKLTSRAVEMIRERAADSKTGRPFFLYLAFSSPHTPILPTAEWQGKSGLSSYGDFVMQTDWAVGEVLAALDRYGLAENTLVVLTSDNGCSPAAGIPEMEAKGHHPSFVFRGHKADIFDGGHRIPFIGRWPGRIKPATTGDQLICLTDFFATCAEILGVKLPDEAAEDSVSILAALEGRADRRLREAIVHHSMNGSFSIRQDQWKLVLCGDSGGWSAPRPNTKEARDLPPIQLFDLSADIGERKNVQEEHPEIVARLTGLLEKYVADGRSTPGTPQKNTGDVTIHRRSSQARGSAKEEQ